MKALTFSRSMFGLLLIIAFTVALFCIARPSQAVKYGSKSLAVVTSYVMDLIAEDDITAGDDVVVGDDLTVTDTATVATAAITTSTISGGVTIGSGTQVKGLLHGTITVASGSATGAATITGITTSHKLQGTIQSGNSSAVYLVTLTPTANTATATLSGTPGASTPIFVTAWLP